MTRFLAYMFVALSAGCTGSPDAEQIINKSILAITGDEPIKTIMANADCVGPRGEYTSEIHSGEGDYVYFKQVFTYRDQPFEAYVTSWNNGFQVLPDTLVPLDTTSIAFVKGHEFHKMLFDLRNRYGNFTSPQLVEIENVRYNKIQGVDRRGEFVDLYFEISSDRLARYSMKNPQNPNEELEFMYSDWRKVDGATLPMHLEILQGEMKYTFDYSRVIVNSSEFQEKAGL